MLREMKVLAGILMASLVGVMAAGSFLTHAYTDLVRAPLAMIVPGLAKMELCQGDRITWSDANRAPSAGPAYRRMVLPRMVQGQDPALLRIQGWERR